MINSQTQWYPSLGSFYSLCWTQPCNKYFFSWVWPWGNRLQNKAIRKSANNMYNCAYKRTPNNELKHWEKHISKHCYIWVKCGTVLITEQQWTMKNLHLYFFHVLTHCWLLKYTIVQSTYVQSIERNINQDFSEWTLKHTLFTSLLIWISVNLKKEIIEI